MSKLYVLKLEHDKYYVGRSNDPQRRFREHADGRGAAWTRRHRPLAIVHTSSLSSTFDEDRCVKELMKKHGIDSVRGGAYVTETLDDAARTSLQREV